MIRTAASLNTLRHASWACVCEARRYLHSTLLYHRTCSQRSTREALVFERQLLTPSECFPNGDNIHMSTRLDFARCRCNSSGAFFLDSFLDKFLFACCPDSMLIEQNVSASPRSIWTLRWSGVVRQSGARSVLCMSHSTCACEAPGASQKACARPWSLPAGLVP